ncbi:MAG: Na/Pi cotransporter family protein [Candidatus Riflebacteria bacterium]|jgi:phosphate:Na+ symporter|nr:Na/Pi cotransporter family protein [Candidatus Riflebacteria bacterium]
MLDKNVRKNIKLSVKWGLFAAFIAGLVALYYWAGSEACRSFAVFSGSLGMFIYGMNLMSNSLQMIAGNRLKSVISSLTRNPFAAMLTGLAVTATIQSSSATTVMVVGFVNAGLMTLKQAIGVILGANIGTTVTAQLIAFKLDDLAWPVLAIGSAMVMVCKSRKNRSWGEVLLGFAFLFIGMKLMGDTLKVYREHETFKHIFVNLSQNRLLGVFAGLLVTFVIQSSSATVGLTMSLMGTGAFGEDPFLALVAAVPIILGDNIGTCITAVLASLGASRNARRAALAHTMFNVFGTLIILPVLDHYCRLIILTSEEPMRQVANAHTLFNVANGLLFLPFIGFLQKTVLVVLPQSEDEPLTVTNLDKRFLATPPVAIAQAEAQLKQAFEIINKKFFKINDLLKSADNGLEEVATAATTMDSMRKQRDEISQDLNRFLIALAQKNLPENLGKQVTRAIYLSKDLEIVSSQLEKFVSLLAEQTENGRTLSDEAREELHLCMERIMEIYGSLSANLQLTEKETKNILHQIYSHSLLNRAARTNLLHRIKTGQHDPLESIILLDSLRSVDSLLSSLKYFCEHSMYKF